MDGDEEVFPDSDRATQDQKGHMRKLTGRMIAEAFRQASQADRKTDPDDKRSTGEIELDTVAEVLNKEMAK